LGSVSLIIVVVGEVRLEETFFVAKKRADTD
jgi:hypothetical protein